MSQGHSCLPNPFSLFHSNRIPNFYWAHEPTEFFKMHFLAFFAARYDYLTNFWTMRYTWNFT